MSDVDGYEPNDPKSPTYTDWITGQADDYRDEVHP